MHVLPGGLELAASRNFLSILRLRLSCTVAIGNMIAVGDVVEPASSSKSAKPLLLKPKTNWLLRLVVAVLVLRPRPLLARAEDLLLRFH